MGKYEEIRDYLKVEALRPESRLRMPTVRSLMRRFSASQSPVMRAVRDLQEAGILECRAGSGITSTGGVQTHPVAQERVQGRNGRILFLHADYFAENIWNMGHRLHAYCQQQDLVLTECKLHQNSHLLTLLEACLEAESFRGIVILSAANRISADVIRFLSEKALPTILLDCEFHYDSLPANIAVLHPAPEDMGRKAAEYFILKGHRRIGYIRNEPMVAEEDGRRNGFLAVARERGVSAFAFSAAIKSWENSMDAAVKVTADSLDEIRRHGITALLYTSLAGAFAGKRVLQESGMRVPEDIAVMGGGNQVIGRYSFPPLTAITCDYERMSMDAIDLLLGNRSWERELWYEYTLIERSSTK